MMRKSGKVLTCFMDGDPEVGESEAYGDPAGSDLPCTPPELTRNLQRWGECAEFHQILKGVHFLL